jgi:murein DD-endopeptidase MepM/ murein hydrolase activator NlpD
VTRLAALAALIVALTAGPARADVFEVVPAAPAVPAVPLLPSAATSTNTTASVFGGAYRRDAPQLSYLQLVELWQRAGAAYGIPWQVLGAINKVESNFGRNMGPSSAGAIGWMQFMPSTWARWGIDANQDGVADPWNADDAVYSAARYLAAAGGRTNISRAVFAYNHAQWYVDEVLGLSRLFGVTGVDATFTLDRLSIRVDQARRTVAQVNTRLAASIRVDRKLFRSERLLVRRAEAAPLLSDQLPLQKLATRAAVRRDKALSITERLRRELASARASLVAARSRAVSAPFALNAAPLGAGVPMKQGSYVFPVGGGASAVSVAHSHHDYRAADIAAPESSPVYALANGTVLSAWRLPDARCGMGFTMQTVDGRAWTYCHLSYLEPAVVEGAPLQEGQLAGLVGHTGDASGPHLHLQLQPSTAYPQEMRWFRAFAGSAFRWQDAVTPSSGPVFAVVPTADDVVTFSAR